MAKETGKIRVINDEKPTEPTEPTEKMSGIEAIILFAVKTGIAIVAVLSVVFLIVGAIIKSSILLGIGIMGSGVIYVIVSKAYFTVPQMQEWMIELWGRYFYKAKPGLNFLVPGIMKIGGKITVEATKMIETFLKGNDKIEFADDSADIEVVIRAKVTDSYRANYNISFTGEEIIAIEEKETKKGNVILPEKWMYLALFRVEASLRGECGDISIDDAIKSIAIVEQTKAGIDLKLEKPKFNINISENIKGIVDAALWEKYAIRIEEVLITRIKLSKETEDKRRQQFLEKINIEIEKLKVAQSEQKALQREWDRKGERMGIDAIRKDTSLSVGNILDWDLAMEAARKVEGVTIIGSGDDKSTPVSLGAQFGAGFGAIDNKRDKKRRDEE